MDDFNYQRDSFWDTFNVSVDDPPVYAAEAGTWETLPRPVYQDPNLSTDSWSPANDNPQSLPQLSHYRTSEAIPEMMPRQEPQSHPQPTCSFYSTAIPPQEQPEQIYRNSTHSTHVPLDLQSSNALRPEAPSFPNLLQQQQHHVHPYMFPTNYYQIHTSAPHHLPFSDQPYTSTFAFAASTWMHQQQHSPQSTSAETPMVRPLFKKKRKPNGYPRRPMSSYNVFFKLERQKILKSFGFQEDHHVKEAEDTRSTRQQRGRRLRRIHGVITFEELARRIGRRWKGASKEERDECDRLSLLDMERYRREVELFEKKGTLKEATGDKEETSVCVGNEEEESELNNDTSKHHETSHLEK